MKNVRIISKKIITLFLIICMVSIYFPSLTLISFATNSVTSLDTPTNLKWKDKSTATATWNAVENANYYLVNVIVYDGDTIIGIQETGTSSNEIDLQQEVYTILQSRNLENYQITFNVCAKFISDNEDITSDFSDNCELLNINKKSGIKLATPTNVSIDDNRIARWTDVPEAGLYQIEYSMKYNNTTKTYTTLFVWKNDGKVKDGMFEVDLTNSINNAYKYLKYNNETVEVSFKVLSRASAEDNNYSDSDYSIKSNTITYAQSITKLATPTNVSIDDNRIARWTNVPEAGLYKVEYSMKYNNITKTYTTLFVWKNDGKVKDGMFEVNLANSINTAYNYLKYGDKTVEISIKVAPRASAEDNLHIDGDFSEKSNTIFYNPNGSTVINEITLSPNKPVIAVGRTLYIGKTIDPENAIYDKIIWSTSDNSIVSINNMGQITGVKKGNATITAKINNATQDADVSVYEIESNINNTEQATAVINEANDVIEAITKNEDISNTDIIDKESVLNEVEQGAQNGDMFSVDIKYYEKSATEYNEIKDIMKSRYAEYNIAGGSDIKISISHTDNKDSEHHIANITELENEINVEFDIPNNIPELAKTKKRIYKLVRLHNENIEDVDFEISNGKIVTSSDKFSDFVLLYKDTELPTFNLSGTISSYDSETDDITIQLYKVNEIEVFKEKSVKGNNTNYSLENVPVGDYIVKLSKNNHVTREYTITLDNSSIDLDTKLCLFGDINNDGKVNGKDWIRLYEHINETNELTDYELLCGDVNKDGKVNGKDWIRLYEHINETNPLF